MAAAARRAAFRALRALSAGRVDLGEALARERDPLPDARDRALATELVTGTLRWRGAIDYQLQRLSSKPLKKLDPAVLDALRVGAYQLLFLERVPVSATVNDSVDLVKRAGLTSAGGFVNAVLRRLAREQGSLPWPDKANLIEHLAVVHSHPAWLVRRWVDRYGPEAAEQWLRFNNETPAITLAPNRFRSTREGLAKLLSAESVDTRPTRVAPHGLVVTNGRPLASAAFASGVCLVQDEASQIVPELLRPQPGQVLLDACASPGGKTVALAADVAPAGLVVATDVRPKRVQVLADTTQRMGAANVRIVHMGATAPLPFGDAVFDGVLVDAPCSGLGTLRRDPDIRWRRTPDHFAALASVQTDLLERLARVVKPGGTLVYSTCSSEPEENEHVVTAFLERVPAFRVHPLGLADLPEAIAQLQTPEGYLRTTPLAGLEAFFAAILRKQ
jgi:16S rRNA (cytosine967-C5)-methyltransferase